MDAANETKLPESDRTALVRARKALVFALIWVVLSPFLAAIVALLFLLGVRAFNVGSLGLLMTLVTLAGVCLGIPSARMGWGALKSIDHSLSSSPKVTATRHRAALFARAAVALGVVAGIVGVIVESLFVLAGSMGAPGRPFRRNGRPTRPEVSRDPSWSGVPPLVPALDPGECQRRAERWLADARAEHASIAAFCRLALDLLSLGSPPELIQATLRAALEEVTHARFSFALASAYAGESLSAGPMPAASGGDAAGRVRLAAASVVDGWLNESAAAVRASRDAARADNAFERAALTTIASDEATHATLGRNIAAWAIGRHPVAATGRPGATSLNDGVDKGSAG